MPLSRLRVRSTRVSDLSPLRGIPLVELNCSSTQVKDLSPLEGAPLKQLYVDDTQISDLSPIREAPLETLKISEPLAVRNMQLLRAISTLKTINNEPASEFWEKHK